MADADPRPFGDHGRDYAANTIPTAAAGGQVLNKQVIGFLREYDPELQFKVQRAFKQWNNVVRDYLRNEMGLRLTVGDETQAIPVRIVAGLPTRFGDLIGSIDPAVWPFLLRIRVLETAVDGLRFTEAKYPELFMEPQSEIRDGLPPGFRDSWVFVERLLSWLKKRKVQEQIKDIHEDILGAYFFRVPEISLYWMVIGIMAGVIGVPVEALTVVVLAHELSHAYSHLGRDIDSTRWDTEAFARADMSIAEGIAQFYTEAVCRKLEERFPVVGQAYRGLLEYQSGPYRVHEQWANPEIKVPGNNDTGRAGEVVRSCLIECRKTATTSYEKFESTLRESHARLREKRLSRVEINSS